MLDDGRDAIRNAALVLLVDLTSNANDDLRKIIAFEDVFVRIFAMIKMDGGLAEAGVTAQDCLSLLANLTAGSASNQTMFRESGCVVQVSQLLEQVFPPSDAEAPYLAQSREKSAFGLLQLLRFFFVAGESSTSQNQTAFFRAGAIQTLIDIGFSNKLAPAIRSASLRCAADLVAMNQPNQEAFASLTVVAFANVKSPAAQSPAVNGSRSSNSSNKTSARPSAEQKRTYVIEALLSMTLDRSADDPTLRTAACGLLQAYLGGHDLIRAHFLHRAISGHAQHETASNVLSTLAQPAADPLGIVLASWILQDLVTDAPDAKSALLTVKEGSADEGEDVLSFIQTLGSDLAIALTQDSDERVIAAYGSLLVTLLWEFAEGIDDLLADSSTLLQALVSPKPSASSSINKGVAATLLGTVYEFSTKDSPVPRRTIAPLLVQKLTRRKYFDALAELRRHPLVRDFDLDDSDGGDVVFSRTFVELFTVEYARLRKAVDKDPGMEVISYSASEAGVDRDVLDDLRQQLQTSKDALAQFQNETTAASQKHEQDQLAASKELQTATAEVQRLRRINQAMQQGHESELETLAAEHNQRTRAITAGHNEALTLAEQTAQQRIHTATRESEARSTEKFQDYERRIAELGNSHRAEQGGHENTRRQLEAMTKTHTELSSQEREQREKLAELSQRHSRLEREHEQLQVRSSSSSAEVEQLRKESQSHQSDVERLSTQLKDLQDELKARDEELATERAGFADLEKELEAAKGGSENLRDGDAAGMENLRTLLEEARESEKGAREELESMLLVMGDIEARRDAYRDKVKQLGGAVSEADDEDEDGEEEDDEEAVD